MRNVGERWDTAGRLATAARKSRSAAARGQGVGITWTVVFAKGNATLLWRSPRVLMYGYSGAAFRTVVEGPSPYQGGSSGWQAGSLRYRPPPLPLLARRGGRNATTFLETELGTSAKCSF